MPANHQESIYGMVLQSLFSWIISDQCDIHRIKEDSEDIIAEAIHIPSNIVEMPVRLTVKEWTVWVLDQQMT